MTNNMINGRGYIRSRKNRYSELKKDEFEMNQKLLCLWSLKLIENYDAKEKDRKILDVSNKSIIIFQ